MKKVLSFAVVASIIASSLVACGPSAEEKAKEQAMKDSIEQARVADSLARAAEASSMMMSDSIAKADSMAKADSLAKATPAKK